MKKTGLAALMLCLALVLPFAAGCGDREDGSAGSTDTSSGSEPSITEESGEAAGEANGEADDGASYDGTYLLCNENPILKAVSLTLTGRAWELQLPDETLSGSFTVAGGRIRLQYALRAEDSFGRELIGNGGKEGDGVELFAGIAAPGTVYLALGAGLTASDFEYIFFLNGELPDVSGDGWADPSFDGSYASEAYGRIRLNGGTWTEETEWGTTSGAYGIRNGRIFLFYTVDGSDSLGQGLMEYQQMNEGDVVYLYGGSVGEGLLTLDSYMGERTDPAVYRAERE